MLNVWAVFCSLVLSGQGIAYGSGMITIGLDYLGRTGIVTFEGIVSEADRFC